MTVKRSIRVAERVREEIARAIERDLRDPRVADVVVTRVEMPDDLQLARVMVRLMKLRPGHTGNIAVDPDRQRTTLSGLYAAAGLLRKQLGIRLGLRRSPQLEFRFDESPEAVDRIEAVLQEIRADDAERATAEPADDAEQGTTEPSEAKA